MIQEKIEEILSKRNQNKQNLETKLKYLHEIKDNITKINLNNDKLSKIINDLEKTLFNEYNKSKRNSLNILVTGIARQGKSTFLQTVTGLSNKQIPTSDGKDLTASKSIIKNSPLNKAIVKYLSKKEFLDLINSYYKELGLETISSLEEFKNDTTLKELTIDGTKGKYKEDLIFLQENFSGFGYKLDSGEEEIDIEEVRKFVAYEDENGNKNLPLFAAVKEVIVYTYFSNKEVGKIAFIDLPGIDDVKIDLLERVTKEIKENVDAVFMIKKPNNYGDKFNNNDYKLYDTLKSNLEEKIEDIVYILLNNTNDNLKQCNILLEDLKKEDTTLKVKDSFIVNVKDINEVNNFMKKVLEDIVIYIDKSDKEELEKINNYFHQMQEEILKMDQTLEVDIYPFAAEFVKNLETEFVKVENNIKEQEIFREVYKNAILKEINNLRKEELLQEKTKKLTNILKASHAYNIIPRTKYFAAELANEIIINVTKNVDEALNNKLNDIKLEVSHAIANAGFNANNEEALKIFIESLNSSLVEKLKNLLEEFYKFKFNFEMLLETEIANHFKYFLEQLDNINTKQDVESIAMNIIQYDLDDTLIMLRDNLIKKYGDLPDEIIKAIVFKTLTAYSIDQNMRENLGRFIEKNFHLLKTQNDINSEIDKQLKLKNIENLIEGALNA